MHIRKPGSWSTWAYHSQRWSSHTWRTSEGIVGGVCLPISNSAMLRKILLKHKTIIVKINFYSLSVITWLRNKALMPHTGSKGYWIGFHSREKGFSVCGLARCLSVAFYFQILHISLSTEIHTKEKHIFKLPTYLMIIWVTNKMQLVMCNVIPFYNFSLNLQTLTGYIGWGLLHVIIQVIHKRLVNWWGIGI